MHRHLKLFSFRIACEKRQTHPESHAHEMLRRGNEKHMPCATRTFVAHPIDLDQGVILAHERARRRDIATGEKSEGEFEPDRTIRYVIWHRRHHCALTVVLPQRSSDE